MAKREKIELISNTKLMNSPMRKRRFIVEGLIYPGLHVLSGDPKIGKSWMMLDMCIAVAKGEKFLGRRTEQGQVVYMALEDTQESLQSRLYELTDEPSEYLSFTVKANQIGSGMEEDLRDFKRTFSSLNLVVIDTFQKVRNSIDAKYGSDYSELSALKSIADELGIAVVLVHHNRKARDSNPNNLILGTNGIAGCADGLLVFTRDNENAKLNVSGRGAPSFEMNLKRENAKWILLDKFEESKPDNFTFIIHDFISERKYVSGTASEICSELKEKYPEQEFKCNWLYRDLLQHDDEIRSLGIVYGKTKSNGVRSIFISYNSEKDSSGCKVLCPENVVPAIPENLSNADEFPNDELSQDDNNEDDADPAVPEYESEGNALISMVAEMMRMNLTKKGVNVPPFNEHISADLSETSGEVDKLPDQSASKPF